MAEPSFPKAALAKAVSDKEEEEEESDEEDETKMKGKTKGSTTKDGDLCPHKAYPANFVKRNLLKTQKDYTNFLHKSPREGHPWYIPPEKIKVKLRNESSFKWLAQARRLKLRAKLNEESEEEKVDISKYIVMEYPGKRKKKKKKKTSRMGYEIKVNRELAFLLDIMAESKEIMIQKAIDNQRQKEEEEKKAKETGDVTVLKNIVQGMMFKVMQEHEESQKVKQQKKKDKKVKKKKGKSKKKEKGEDNEEDGKFLSEEAGSRRQIKRMKENTTKELVTFLKELVDNDKKKKEQVYEDKAVSPYASEEYEKPVVPDETVDDEIIEEEEEEEEDEEEIDEEAEEGEEGEGKEEISDRGKLESDSQELMKEDKEGVVDMDEVKKKLEEIKQTENGSEGEREGSDTSQEVESSEEKLSDEKLSKKSDESESIEPKASMSDKSAQFNYFHERKAMMEKKPKNVTDDLVQFLKTMITTDDNMREIMKEKELLEFKRKQLDFMTMGMLLNKPDKSKHSKKGKRSNKNKKCQSKDVQKDTSYNIRPNEFMVMLQVVMNSLDIMEEQKTLDAWMENMMSSKSSCSDDGAVHDDLVSGSRENKESFFEDDDENDGDDEEEDSEELDEEGDDDDDDEED